MTTNARITEPHPPSCSPRCGLGRWRVVAPWLLAVGTLFGGCGNRGGEGDRTPPSTRPSAPDTSVREGEPAGPTAKDHGAYDESEAGGGIPTAKKILAEAKANMVVAEGGVLKLEDGFVLEVPPGALARDASVRVTKMRLTAGPSGVLEDLVCYELDTAEAHGAALAGRARVTLPVPAKAGTQDLRVTHYLRDGTAEVLPHVLVREGRVQVELTSFSWLSVAVLGPMLWSLSPYPERLRVAEEVIQNASEKRILPVPYYSQSDYAWCWATSAAMVFGAQGATIQPQEVAALFDAERSQGGSFWPRVFGNSFDFHEIAAGAGLPALPMRMHAFGGMWEKSLRGWIIQQLRASKPVWVGLRKYDAKGGDHAIVVVGYDHVGFYVNDPSGALLAHLAVLRGEASRTTKDAVDEGKLAQIRVPYGDWKKVMAPGMLHYRPWLTNIGLVDVPVRQGRKVSMQIQPGTLSAGLQFHRDGFSFANLSSSQLYWNGEQPLGAGFSRPYAYPDRPEEARKLGASFLSNSDALLLLRVLLHNTGAAPFEGSVHVTLDGEAIGATANARVSAVAGTTNQSISVVENASIVRFRDPKSKSYVGAAARAGMPLTEALNFMGHPLPIGKHMLTVALQDAAGVRVDRIRVPFEMHPAVPRAVRVENVTRAIGGRKAVVHKITWDASPEEARLRALGRKGKYMVYRVGTRDADMNTVELVAGIAARDIARYEAGAEAPQGKRVRYTVAFRDLGSGYDSPLCQPSRQADDRPPREAPAFTWHWAATCSNPGEISVQLQKKALVGLMDPYILVVESHGDRQYLYPHNATGYKGQRLSQTYHLVPGKATETLKVTAFLSDGTIRKGTVPIDYRRSRPPRAIDAAELVKWRKEARREFDRGLASEWWRGAGQLVQGHRRMQTWIWAKETRTEAHTQALAKLRSLFDTLDAKNKTRYRVEYAKLLDRIQTQRMALLQATGETDEYVALLKARHEAGNTHPREYVRGAASLIRHHNDTARAHALWRQFQERVPQWVAGLTADDFKRSPSLKRDARTYPKMAKKDLCYPVPPLRAK